MKKTTVEFNSESVSLLDALRRVLSVQEKRDIDRAETLDRALRALEDLIDGKFEGTFGGDKE